VNKKTVLIIGGTGLLARPVVREFVKRGFIVRLLARSPERVRTLFGPAVEVVEGDLTRPSTLDSAMLNVNLTYINLPATHNPNLPFVAEREGMAALLQALPRQVPILKLSEIGAGSDTTFADLDLKHKSELLIAASGHPYLIFRPTWFMESLPYLLTQRKMLAYFGQHPNPIYWIAGADYARMVVTGAERMDELGNRIFTMQGLQAHTFGSAADQYIALFDPSIRRINLPLWVAALAGRFSGEWLFVHQLMRYYSGRTEALESGEAWDLLGRPTVTLQQFARELRSRVSV
jgi:uncharacterized protein YbjT (DUF2867 family)